MISQCRARAWLGTLMAVLLFPGAALLAVGADQAWSVASPDGQCAITVSRSPEGRLSYTVKRAGQTVLNPSPLGLRREDQAFEEALTLASAGPVTSRRERYELLAGTRPRVDHVLKRRTLEFRNAAGAPLLIELAAGNEGVAFRYGFPETNAAVRVLAAELTGFAVPVAAQGWLQPYPAAGPYTPAYEDFYYPVSPGERPQDSRGKAVGWAFPALFQVPAAAAWVLLTESGTDASFCACHLQPESDGGIYRLAFPLADEATKGYPNTTGPEPRATLPWIMPWRVIVLGQTAGDIALSTLVTDLAPPSQIADPSWIHPGRASWAWWSYPDEPATAKRFDEFTDFARHMGWEYTLFDAGWWTPGLKTIADHAHAQGVVPMAWLHAEDFNSAAHRTAKLAEMEAAGIRGVKVDFWCSDRQEAIAAQQGLLREAAARKLVVNLHGCTIPRGWQRTWPNFLTCEAVLGSESYFYESRYPAKAAELNTVLPFTRNVVGPMDLTPVACTLKQYRRTTTAAHQLAAALIFTSGIVHYAEQPEFFETLPATVQKLFRDAPARWDETRCLVGEPGQRVVFARRTGNSWFIAGLNGTDSPRLVQLDLSAFKKYRHRLAVVEGSEPIMQVEAAPLAAAADWQRVLPPRGGFILRLDR